MGLGFIGFLGYPEDPTPAATEDVRPVRPRRTAWRAPQATPHGVAGTADASRMHPLSTRIGRKLESE